MTIPHNQQLRSGADVADETTLPLDGGSIHVRQDVLRGAPVLLLVHGSGASTRSWGPLVPLLARSHHVIRIDLLGHGRSDKPADGDYEVVAQGRRAAAALDRFGIENAFVAGHSSGGYTATALAEQRPDLVTALAVINTGPRLEALVPQEGAIDASQWPRLTDEQIRQAMATGFSRPGYEPPQELVDDLRRMTHHSFTTTMQASSAYLRDQPLPERLAAVGKPLLVVCGADDRRWRPPFFADYQSVPGAEVEMLPGLGHSPLLEDPQQTAEHLLAFTARHAESPA